MGTGLLLLEISVRDEAGQQPGHWHKFRQSGHRFRQSVQED